MTADELEALVRRGKPGEVPAAFAEMSEAERVALAPAAARLEKQCAREENAASRAYYAAQQPQLVPGSTVGVYAKAPPGVREALEAAGAQQRAACLALVGTASGTELMRRSWMLRGEEPFEILARRRPPWLWEWADKAVTKDWGHWSLCHRLVQAGLSQRPPLDNDNWVLGFLAHRGSKSGGGHVKDPGVHLADPLFVNGELWRLFEIEGTRELNPAGMDHYMFEPATRWSVVLLAHVAQGKLPRERLLDATLGALRRDFNQSQSGWFATLHRALEPTLDERAARADRYLVLLASRIGPTVAFALEALGILEKADRLPAAALLAHGEPALHAPAKKSVLATLAMVERAAAREPALRARAATLVLAALAHEASDVQSRALDLLAKLGGPGDTALRAHLRDRVPHLAPSVRARALAWLGDPEPPSRVELPSAAAAPATQPAAAMPRARSLDEAIDLMAGAIERFDAPADIEAALEGVSRFCGERPPDFEARTAPLLKRALAIKTREFGTLWSGDSLRWDLCAVVMAWRRALEKAGDASAMRSMRTLMSGRMREVAIRAWAARSAPLFATPTHPEGRIDPMALVERARQANPDPLDAIQSLLRLDRDGRATALRAAADVPDEYGAALRHALGGREQSGATADLWVAAEAARLGQAGEPLSDWLAFDVARWVEDAGRRRVESLAVRWAATVFPGDLEPYFAAGSKALADNIDWSSALWWNQFFLDPLLRANVSLGPSARRLLALGLAAKQATEGGLAADALIQAIDDGRADAAALGDGCAELLDAGVTSRRELSLMGESHVSTKTTAVTLARWAKRLGDVARRSARHAAFVRKLIERSLRGLPASPPPDLSALLTLLHELCVETGGTIEEPEARQRLATVRGSGQAARLARALLALQCEPLD